MKPTTSIDPKVTCWESIECSGDDTSILDSWATQSKSVELGYGEVHVWRAYLDCEPTVIGRFEATLAPEEKARANRFVFQKDRNSFIVSRGVLRDLLGRYVNRPPEQLKFDYSWYGKPSLCAELIEQRVQFNTSHSRGLALFAFALGRRLGIDVELVRPDFAGEKIAELYFSPREAKELRALPPSLRAEGFFLCWTRKEAYIKARGEGLHIPLESFHVSLTPGQPELLQSADSMHWSLHSLCPDSRYVGALVGEDRNWRPRYWEWKPEFC